MNILPIKAKSFNNGSVSTKKRVMLTTISLMLFFGFAAFTGLFAQRLNRGLADASPIRQTDETRVADEKQDTEKKDTEKKDTEKQDTEKQDTKKSDKNQDDKDQDENAKTLESGLSQKKNDGLAVDEDNLDGDSKDEAGDESYENQDDFDNTDRDTSNNAGKKTETENEKSQEDRAAPSEDGQLTPALGDSDDEEPQIDQNLESDNQKTHGQDTANQNKNELLARPDKPSGAEAVLPSQPNEPSQTDSHNTAKRADSTESNKELDSADSSESPLSETPLPEAQQTEATHKTKSTTIQNSAENVGNEDGDNQVIKMRRQLEADGQNSQLAMQLAAIYEQSGVLREAKVLYQQILRYDPVHLPALVALGKLENDEKLLQAALAQVNHQAVDQKDSGINKAQIHFLLGRIYARKYFGHEVVSLSGRKVEEYGLSQHRQLAEENLLQAKANSSRDQYRQLATLNLAFFNFHCSRWQQSSQYFTEYLDSQPDDIQALKAMALVQKKLSDDEKLRNTYQRILDLQKNYQPALEFMARDFLDQQDFPQAKEYAQTLTNYDSQQVESHWLFYEILEAEDNSETIEQRLEVLKSIAKINPSHPLLAEKKSTLHCLMAQRYPQGIHADFCRQDLLSKKKQNRLTPSEGLSLAWLASRDESLQLVLSVMESMVAQIKLLDDKEQQWTEIIAFLKVQLKQVLSGKDKDMKLAERLQTLLKKMDIEMPAEAASSPDGVEGKEKSPQQQLVAGYIATGQYERCIAEVSQWLQDDQLNIGYLQMLARCHREDGNYRDSDKILSKILINDEKNLFALEEKAYLYYHLQQDKDKFIVVAKKLLNYYPNHPQKMRYQKLLRAFGEPGY